MTASVTRRSGAPPGNGPGPLPSNRDAPPTIIGDDRYLGGLRDKVKLVSGRDCTVLICGESGTGKELLARSIHAAGPRAGGPFVVADCTTLRSTMFESQLFGHVKGAFTGAQCSTLGLFRAAHAGTLFLDEVGELDLQVQSKLLRCLQEKSVLPLGAVEPVSVDVRVISASHRDLKEMVQRRQFREDLYFRLDVIRLDVPPLRSRPGDIALLAGHFVEQLGRTYGEPAKALADDLVRALEQYPWPGNVRELRNAIEHAFVFAENGRLTAADLPETVRGYAAVDDAHACESGPAACDGRTVVPLRVAEKHLIKRALRATRGNRARAALLLEVERHRLSRMIRRHGLQDLAKSLS